MRTIRFQRLSLMLVPAADGWTERGTHSRTAREEAVRKDGVCLLEDAARAFSAASVAASLNAASSSDRLDSAKDCFFFFAFFFAAAVCTPMRAASHTVVARGSRSGAGGMGGEPNAPASSGFRPCWSGRLFPLLHTCLATQTQERHANVGSGQGGAGSTLAKKFTRLVTLPRSFRLSGSSCDSVSAAVSCALVACQSASPWWPQPSQARDRGTYRGSICLGFLFEALGASCLDIFRLHTHWLVFSCPQRQYLATMATTSMTRQPHGIRTI